MARRRGRLSQSPFVFLVPLAFMVLVELAPHSYIAEATGRHGSLLWGDSVAVCCYRYTGSEEQLAECVGDGCSKIDGKEE